MSKHDCTLLYKTIQTVFFFCTKDSIQISVLYLVQYWVYVLFSICLFFLFNIMEFLNISVYVISIGMFQSDQHYSVILEFWLLWISSTCCSNLRADVEVNFVILRSIYKTVPYSIYVVLHSCNRLNFSYQYISLLWLCRAWFYMC